MKNLPEAFVQKGLDVGPVFKGRRFPSVRESISSCARSCASRFISIAKIIIRSADAVCGDIIMINPVVGPDVKIIDRAPFLSRRCTLLLPYWR